LSDPYRPELNNLVNILVLYGFKLSDIMSKEGTVLRKKGVLFIFYLIGLIDHM